MTESDRLRAHAKELRLLAQTISLKEDRAFFAKLADDYERRAARLEGEQQIGRAPPPPPPASDQTQAAQPQQQVQPKKDK